jgi:hypothetical protein
MRKVSTAKTGNENARCCQLSSDSHQATSFGGGFGGAGFIFAILLLGAACDPLQGSGAGAQPDVAQFIHVDQTSRSAVVTLIAGHPATDNQFNYDGYGRGALVLSVPVGWQVTIQCQNHGTVPNSCSVVRDAGSKEPVKPAWTTLHPQSGLSPGQSDSFVFDPAEVASYRIASLVGGNEASGMWLDLEVVAGGKPSLKALG